jgi:hypothetical protein
VIALLISADIERSCSCAKRWISLRSAVGTWALMSVCSESFIVTKT